MEKRNEQRYSLECRAGSYYGFPLDTPFSFGLVPLLWVNRRMAMSNKVMPEVRHGQSMRMREIKSLPSTLRKSELALSVWWQRQTQGSGGDSVYWDCTADRQDGDLDLHFLANLEEQKDPALWLAHQLRRESDEKLTQAEAPKLSHDGSQQDLLDNRFRHLLREVEMRREKNRAALKEADWQRLGRGSLGQDTVRLLCAIEADVIDQKKADLRQCYRLIAVALGKQLESEPTKLRRAREHLLEAALEAKSFLLATELLTLEGHRVMWTPRCDRRFDLRRDEQFEVWDRLPEQTQDDFAWAHALNSDRPMFQALLYAEKFKELAQLFGARVAEYEVLAGKFAELACNVLTNMPSHFDAAISLEEKHSCGGHRITKTAIDIAIEGQILVFISHPRVHRVMYRWWNAPLLRCPDDQLTYHFTGHARTESLPKASATFAAARKHAKDFWIPFQSWFKKHETGMIVPVKRWLHNSQQFSQREYVSPFDGLAGSFRLFRFQPEQFFLLPQCAFLLEQVRALRTLLRLWCLIFRPNHRTYTPPFLSHFTHRFFS